MVETLFTVILSAVGGGAGLKLIQYYFPNKKEKQDSSITLIITLEKHIQGMDARIDKIQTELDNYREKYFSLQLEYTGLKSEHDKLKVEHSELKKQFEKMKGAN